MAKKRIGETDPFGEEVDIAVEETETLPQAAQRIYGGPLAMDPKVRSLKLSEDGSVVAGRFRLTSVGIDLHEDIKHEEYEQLGRALLQMGSVVQWCLGDWLAYGEDRQWKTTYETIAQEFGYQVDTLYIYAWLSRHVKILIRNQDLSPSHHRLIAKFDDEKTQRWWLEWAATANNGKPVSISQMRQAIKDWENENSPTLSNSARTNMHNPLITREKPREFRQFLKLASKAGQGDVKAKQRALGQIVEYRQWLDEMEEWLKG